MAVVIGAEMPGAGVEAERDPNATRIKKTLGDEIGASISHPAELRLERERYTIDDTQGYTLWQPEEKATTEHGGTPVVRVALAYDMKPGQIKSAVRDRLDELSDVPVKRQYVTVGKKKYKGVAVGPIPGSTPSIEVYVPVQNRVYQINLYEEKLDAEGKELLAGLEFAPPSRSTRSLRGLPDGDRAQTFQQQGDKPLVERELKAREATDEAASRKTAQEGSSEPVRNLAATAQPTPVYEEYMIGEGCWRARSTFSVQTQHGAYANGTGWTRLGIPNYWGQYTHGNLGYGRCSSTYYTNDKFAIDYPLRKGDVLFSPFASGTVTFAGRNNSHKNYGIFVVIRSDNGKYVSMSAHLNGLARGIYRGARVTNTSIIGFAGDSGDPSIPVGEPHLHQAFYRYPYFLSDGSPYGGKGLQVLYHRFTGTAAKKIGQPVDPNPYYNVYYFGAVKPDYQATCREGIVCGEGYRVSN
ncbi:peptidoglycan DD-metalloendopeptidase family protein [Rubrobacter marinus]|uniref:Peptidoglycan DD-metalloendopeptidase family protein n=1 Tax=Rubrobacter marinus TaxID=2653852 RepID=A0A6G8PUK9_9ACTN|nr:M23 family metallopeptidase [Rubrobacter marinus]QIN77862.1 peptidoglycan DD-metalloendopeptidase family protein [Rubrobacter marinus]